MTWGYRLDTLTSREMAELRTCGRGCAVGRCSEEARYRSAYRYVRSGRPVTVTRGLCTRHAQLFSMKHTVAWPAMARRFRRPLSSAWAELAA